MTDSDDGTWFSYSPAADNSHLTPEQRALVRRCRAEQVDQPSPGDVRLLFASLESGQAEVRIKAPPGCSTVETISAAIRELEVAREIYRDVD